ncbi:MAG TPA: hypothetical protein VLA54_02065, partial [Acidimicrobiia bacterium]|nr:hypothetical protein [Acidimicrobiia bacterium]
MSRIRDARLEAQSLLPERHVARVLEPSPPAINDGEYRADDPAAVGEAPPGSRVVTPTTAGDVSWYEMARDRPALAGFCVDRWLGPWRRLTELPHGYAETVLDLNQVAFHALAPARYAASGKVGLRYTAGGFGTPFFGPDRQVRLEGTELVIQTRTGARAESLTTLRKAAEFLGVEYRVEWGPTGHDPPAPIDPDRPLQVTAGAVAAIAD